MQVTSYCVQTHHVEKRKELSDSFPSFPHPTNLEECFVSSGAGQYLLLASFPVDVRLRLPLLYDDGLNA